MYFKNKFLLFVVFISFYSFSQEGIPVYSDYLSDNYYLIHPSMAGASSCAKVRLTARKQWFGQGESPALQTLSVNGRLGEKNGVGMILFNDQNGYHSQQGAKLTYAYHLMFSRDDIDLNQLSFGISAGLIQNQLDESTFLNKGISDPIVFGNIQSNSYFNMDVGASYNYLDFYAHLTVQGVVETRRSLYSDFESDNLRKYLLSAGYVLGNTEKILWEPSILIQVIDRTKEKFVDLNLKAYKNMDFGKVWAGLSYRRGIDGALYTDGNSTFSQKLQYFTPILGANYNKFMFAYTYSNVIGDIKFNNGGYHQITLGVNLFCKKEKYDCNCPAIN